MTIQLNKTRNRLFLFLALAGLLLVAVACTTPATTAADAVVEADAAETAAVVENVAADTVGQPEVAAAAPVAEIEIVAEAETAVDVVEESPAVESVSFLAATGELSADEIADLQFMREEEKLAHDVYLALYDVWGMNIFQNIAASEQTHTDAVLGLINHYGLTDIVGDNAIGVFVNTDLQALHDDLVASGSQSLADALLVGTAIEEIDILDLDEALANTGRADITQVYQSLRAGSENHLRAFVSTLERQTGETYQPRYMSAEAYAAVINGSQSQGNGGAGGNGGGGNGNGGNGGGNGRGGSKGNGRSSYN